MMWATHLGPIWNSKDGLLRVSHTGPTLASNVGVVLVPLIYPIKLFFVFGTHFGING